MSFRKKILCLLMPITLTFTETAYSAEFVDIGYRDGLVIEAALNIDGFIYAVADRSDDDYSCGLGIGYQGDFYSSLLSVSQVVDENTYYKSEIQLNFKDGKFNTFAAISASKYGTGYRIGAGYPINEKTSITTYVSDRGFFLGFRRTL